MNENLNSYVCIGLMYISYISDAVACDEPTSNDLIVINYTAPALEGSVIAIECGSLNANSYTSICVEGRWEPNLSQISTRCTCGGGMYADRLWVIALVYTRSELASLAHSYY